MPEKEFERRTDRRTIYTKNVIKDAMLSLMDEMPFEKVTVAALCRRAGIVRTTFYLHYDNLTDVVRELADDAIQAASHAGTQDYHDIATLAKEMQKTTDPQLLAPYMNLLPICQRVADDPKYKTLFRDSMVSDFIIMEISRELKGPTVEVLVKNMGITEKQADKLFLFALTGAYEVNRSMSWEKSREWYEIQKVLLTFLAGGYDALEKNRC